MKSNILLLKSEFMMDTRAVFRSAGVRIFLMSMISNRPSDISTMSLSSRTMPPMEVELATAPNM